MKKPITLIISFILGLALIPAWLEAGELETTRLSIQPDHTRVVIESSSQIRFSLFSLRNPERIILDVEGVDSQVSLEALIKQLGTQHPYIKPVRLSKLKDQQFRIEFPLKVDAEPRISVLKPSGNSGFRLVLDIYPDLPFPITPYPVASQVTPPQVDLIKQESHAVKTPPVLKDHADTIVAKAARSTDELEEMWIAVKINTEDSVRNALVLKRTDGRFLVSKSDLNNWRIKLPGVTPVKHDQEEYYPLDTIRGMSYQLDSSDQTLMIEASPSLYDATTIQGIAKGFVKPSPSPLGGFLNYEVNIGHAQGQTSRNGLLELGIHGPAGVGVSSFLGRDANNASNNASKSVIRLDTTFTKDIPEQLSSLRFGDIINKPGSWGRSVRVGGVQWGTNFSTQPTFISFPLPGLSGEAALPSTVDLFVNDSLRLTKQLPTGPFSIQDLPVVTGMGEARLVTTDILGRERVIFQPYYVTPRLLQKGLHEYSYEAGFIRENYGLQSNDYGRFVAVGTHRLGITDRFTGEIHSEVLVDQQALGLSGVWLMPRIGVFNTSVAASNSKNKQGGLLSLGFERQSRRLGFGVNTQFTSKEFLQTGFQSNQPPPKQLTQAFTSWAAGKGSFGLSYILQNFRDRERVELINASFSTNFFGFGFLGLSALQFLSGDKASIMGFSFTHVIDNRTTASANMTSQSDSALGSLQVQRSLPVGTGYGYQLSQGFGDSDRKAAGLFAQNDMGTYAFEAAQSMGEDAFRANISGGVALINRGAFLTRRVGDSFALVDVPGFPGVRVYADNQVVGTTNSDGHAFIPRLRPYQKNALRIEQADLPMNAQIDSVDLNVIPRFRSGVVAKFPVMQQEQGTIKVMTENAKPIPAGAVAYVTGANTAFPVGLEGEIFLTGLTSKNHIKIIWDQYSCEIDVPYKKSADPLPFLGTYICKGVML